MAEMAVSTIVRKYCSKKKVSLVQRVLTPLAQSNTIIACFRTPCMFWDDVLEEGGVLGCVKTCTCTFLDVWSFVSKDLYIVITLNLINLHVLAGCPLQSQRSRNGY